MRQLESLLQNISATGWMLLMNGGLARYRAGGGRPEPKEPNDGYKITQRSGR